MKFKNSPKNLADPIVRKWNRQREFMEMVGEESVKLTQERIDKTKVTPQGVKWKPWAASTARARQRDGTASRGLLNRTGNLRNSVYYVISGNKVLIGANATYSQYVQQERPFMGSGINEERAIRRIWTKWINS